MQLPVITKCAVDACAYNAKQACQAPAITVGDSGALIAHCDTFFVAPSKGGIKADSGHVGACKVTDCRHNKEFTCRADGITVGFNLNGVDCLTYQK